MRTADVGDVGWSMEGALRLGDWYRRERWRLTAGCGTGHTAGVLLTCPSSTAAVAAAAAAAAACCGCPLLPPTQMHPTVRHGVSGSVGAFCGSQ